MWSYSGLALCSPFNTHKWANFPCRLLVSRNVWALYITITLHNNSALLCMPQSVRPGQKATIGQCEKSRVCLAIDLLYSVGISNIFVGDNQGNLTLFSCSNFQSFSSMCLCQKFEILGLKNWHTKVQYSLNYKYHFWNAKFKFSCDRDRMLV